MPHGLLEFSFFSEPKFRGYLSVSLLAIIDILNVYTNYTPIFVAHGAKWEFVCHLPAR